MYIHDNKTLIIVKMDTLHIMRKVVDTFYWQTLSGAHSTPYQYPHTNGTVGCAVRTMVAG